MMGKIADVVQAYADGVIRSVRITNHLTEREFRESKCPMAVRARTLVIKRLMTDGFTATEVRRFAGFKPGMIERRIHPEWRDRSNELRKLSYRVKKRAALEARP